MSVSKEITRLEKSNVRMTLTIPKEDMASGYRDVLGDYAKNVQIPGFRRGKVPPAVLERKFGEGLKAEALGKIMEEAVEGVFRDENLPAEDRPLSYSRPEIEGEPKFDLEKDLVFSLVYDVLPSVKVGNWKGLEAEVKQSSVGEEDIARELEEVRDRNSFVLDRSEGAKAQSGDIVTLSYSEIGENGEALPGSGRDDFVFTLGKGQNAYEFDGDIEGMAKGETKEFSKTYPADASGPSAAFAGKTVKIRATLNALKEKKLPELDDELAQDVDEKFKTLDDLKKSIRDRLEAGLEARSRELKINAVIEKIMENTPVVLPESMVRAEISGRFSSLARNFGMRQEDVMRMLSQGGDGLDDIEGKWRPTAEKALHSRLIIETLMDEEKIEAGEDELKEEIAKLAAGLDMSEEETKKIYEDRRLDYIKDGIRERKFFDLLLSQNTVKTGAAVSYLDFMGNNG